MTSIRRLAVGTGVGALTVSPALAHPDSHAGVADGALLTHFLSDPYHVGILVTLAAVATIRVLALALYRRRSLGVQGRRGKE